MYFYNDQNIKIQKAREEYASALKGTDKAIALNAGRVYYSALKRKFGLRRMAYGTSLTMADEIAIVNEINTMATHDKKRKR